MCVGGGGGGAGAVRGLQAAAANGQGRSCAARAAARQPPPRTCEYTDTTSRGQPKGLVDLKVTSMGKFHTTDASPVLPFCATCEKPWSMPCRMRHSGPYVKV